MRRSTLSNESLSTMPEVEMSQANLVRGMGLTSAISANMLNMIGVGPFITLGTIISVMGGPQAMLGWILGGLLSICDGLVYAELGAAMPGAGGAYIYFREAFNRKSWGQLFSFLFLWETLFSGPLGIAAACVGFANYTRFLFPKLSHTDTTFIAFGACSVVTVLLYRPIRNVGKLSTIILAFVLMAMGWVVFAGVSHMNIKMAFNFPPNAFHLSNSFFAGLGAATLFAMYNYGGYNNATYLGGEIRNPTRNIPLAILLSILLVGILYVIMSISVLGTIPWTEAAKSHALISEFIGRLYGPRAAGVITILILLATFGGILAMSLGYSRILYAAGTAGDFFPQFGRIHPKGHFPTVALLAINGAAMALCSLPVENLIQAQMIVQIIFQFIPQIFAIFVIRKYRPEIDLPFRMWLFPIPAILALCGWMYVAMTPEQLKYVNATLVLLLLGVVVFLIRAKKLHHWPLQRA